nr:hypothetical protein [Mesorhizobium sp.]
MSTQQALPKSFRARCKERSDLIVPFLPAFSIRSEISVASRDHPPDGCLYGSAGHAPAPGRHRLGLGIAGLAKVGVHLREPRPPFDIGHESRAKFRIVRQPDFIGGIDEKVDPAAALFLAQMLAEMMHDHLAVAAMLCAVGLRAAKHLADESGDMGRMIGRHVLEHRTDDGVLKHLVIEGLRQTIQRVGAAGPFEQCRDILAHSRSSTGRTVNCCGR